MAEIKVNTGQGVTQAIASNLGMSGADVKKVKLSVWQEVMKLVDQNNTQQLSLIHIYLHLGYFESSPIYNIGVYFCIAGYINNITAFLLCRPNVSWNTLTGFVFIVFIQILNKKITNCNHPSQIPAIMRIIRVYDLLLQSCHKFEFTL